MFAPSLQQVVQPRYYDLILAVIPLLFSLGYLTAAFAPLELRTTLVTIGIAAALLIAHALFVEPPVDADASRTA